MASLGRWSGGATTQNPTNSWAAPASIVTTEDRNDGSAYGYAAATSTITLPATDLADGYLVIGAFVHDDTSNGRHNPSGRWIQASGTGNFACGAATGYSRDNTNNHSYVRAWGFIDNPSASATLQFQWRRDADAATGGTSEAYFEVIPLYYSNATVLTSTAGTFHGGTTPTQITGWTAVVDTGGIYGTNQVTLADNKKYLCLGGWRFESSSGARTQRWGGFRLNGTKLDSAKGYAYSRNISNNHAGKIFSHILTSGTGDTMDMFLYRGDGIANGDGGASVDGSTASSAAAHAMVFLELDDGAEFVTDTNSLQTATYTGAGTSILASFKVPNTSDYLVGADISAASFNVSTGTRYQAEAEITVEGAARGHTVAGDYLRNNQGTQGTFGWSANNLSAVSAVAEDAIAAVVNQTGQNGGNPASPAGWVGLFALDLDTLEASGSLSVAPDELSQGNSIGTLTLTQSSVLSVAEAGPIQSLETTALTQAHSLTTEELNQAVSLESSGLTSSSALSLEDALQSTTVDSASITQAHIIGPADANQAVSLETTRLGVTPSLSVNGLDQGQAISGVTLAVAQSLALQDVLQGSELGPVTLTQNYALAIQDALQGLSLDSLLVNPDLLVSGVSQSNQIDATDLSSISVLLAVDEITQEQLIDVLSVNPIVVGKLLGEVAIFTAIDGEIFVRTALTSESIRIYH